MSLRAEYHYSYVSEGGDYIVTAYHRPFKDQEPNQIGEQARVPMDEVDDVGEKLISAHMEKVTRMLEGEPIKAQRSLFDPREDPTESENES